uniref:Uncharacterized protein n=1 Tax=Panagrolaimus sp. PS1159 TaxID=55785 RepID=A0AC35GIX9_9BILA
MKLLIYTIFSFNLITHLITADEVTSNSTTATTASTKKILEATTVNPNLSQNDAFPQSQYNSRRTNYKIAYNQGGATLTAFPVLSKIASIKRERSSVDYNRPLDIDQTSSGLTPQLQKLLLLPINKREATTNIEIKNDEKKEATSKIFSAKHSNFGSNAYKQGGYEGSPDAQAATIKNYLGTMTRTVGKGSSLNQFGGYGTNLGSQSYNSGNDNSWRPQQELIFPSQQQAGAYGLGGFPQHGQMPTSASSSFGSSSNDVMGINNNIGQGSGDMNPINFGASSNINGISSISNNIFQGASKNMQNQWNEGNDFSSNVNNGMGNIGVSQGGSNYGINTDFNTNQQGTIDYGNTIGDNSGLGINGFTGGNSNNNEYASSATAYNGNNNFGTTDYSNLNTNNGFNNYNANANNGYSNINSQTSNFYGTNANTFGVNTVSNGGFSNINTGNFGLNTNDFSNNLGSSINNFGINTNVDNSNMNTADSNNNFGTNNMGSPNLVTNNFGNTGMNINNFGSTDGFSNANTNYQSTNNFNINNNNDNNNNNFGTNMNNNNNAYNGNNDYTKTGITSYMINTENFKANNFGLNNNNAGNNFNSFGSNLNTGNGYSSNSNFGATGNSGFNVNTIPSPVGGFNNVETSMTNNNGFKNSGYNGGNNDGINANYGTTNNGGGNDFNLNNNNAGGFSSFGNSDNTSGNNFNSMNYASSNGNPTSNINGNSNGDFSSTFNNGNQGFGQQQQNGYNSQSSTNFNSQQGSQTFETSTSQQPLVNQPSSQNQFGYSTSNFGQSQTQIQTPMPSQPMTQGNVGDQSVYGNPNSVNYGTYTAGINNLQQSYTDQKNYLNIANKIAQQHALNKPDVYGSQYNSIPPQTYTPDASIISYGTNSMYAGASPISQFGTQNPSSLAGARFSSYGSSTHSSHASHLPKTNIYNVIAPIPTSSTDSKIDGTPAPQSPPPPPTTYKHGSNVYTTIYNTGYDPTSSSSSPSKSGNGGVFSGTEKIGDVYSDNYGHSELTNIYQTKPKTPTKD